MAIAKDLRTALGPIGIWASLDGIPAPEVLRFAATVEELGFRTLWVNESSGREPFAVLGALARTTSRLTLGLGIASIYARDAVAAHAGARTIADLSGGRFVMGLGVSHRSSAGARGHAYAPPVTAMTAYLDAYEEAPWSGPEVDDPPLVLAALGPRMLALAATRTGGAFPYLVTAAHVRDARRALDEAADATGAADRPVLVVSQLAILGDGPAVRATARAAVARYLGQPNYRNNLLRAGIAASDVDVLADPLLDDLVAMGDASDLRTRVRAMHAAGADHVAVIPLSPAGRQADVATARAVAPERG
jgi:probable F420-dependent oxidoreductase